jgi:ribosomal protein S27E
MHKIVLFIKKLFLGLVYLSLFLALLTIIELLFTENGESSATFGFLMIAGFFLFLYFLLRTLTKKIPQPQMDEAARVFKKFKCENCNASKVIKQDEQYLCAYCGSTLGVVDKL